MPFTNGLTMVSRVKPIRGSVVGISRAKTVSKTLSAFVFTIVVFPALSVSAILGALAKFSHVKVGSILSFGWHRTKHFGGESCAVTGRAKHKTQTTILKIFTGGPLCHSEHKAPAHSIVGKLFGILPHPAD